jgi:peptidoglycan/xylan/chitin deacetylase (PgdA/CDA1 family)
MDTQTEQTVLKRARRRLRLRRGLRRIALVLGILAAAACIGEFCALWALSARVARLEALAGIAAPQEPLFPRFSFFSQSEAGASVNMASESSSASDKAAPQDSAAESATSDSASSSAQLKIFAAGAYEKCCPALYATPLPPQDPPAKTVYLTFDDGPSDNTPAILDVLEQYGIKGTWFMVGTQLAGREELAYRIDAEGHTLALHSDSHSYADIYASPEAFLSDLDSLSFDIEEITGRRPGLVRFAGGSVNAYDAGFYTELTAEVLRRGLRYYDWNVSAQDAVKRSPGHAVIARRVISGVEQLDAETPAVVLMHDSKATTPLALPEILSTLSAEGYTFAALDSSVPMVAFSGGETL